MKVPLSWLRKYVPVDLPIDEVAHLLTMAGNEVASVERIGADWDPEKVLVGQVLKVDPHPNADRLSLPTVDLGGGETATVVCGAPNVAEGQRIAFAREGAMLFSPRSGKVEPLKAAKIRGIVSSGMVCSELELGLGESHEGIIVLGDDAPLGTPLVDYLGDVVLDLELTPNRPDCLSILGIAHEVAALTGEAVTEPDASYPEEGQPVGDLVRIEIADPDLCPRYTASLINGVKIGPSPRWLQEALTRAGQRPINNVVDITNYVMLEYGQPLHAFDFDVIKDRTIIVRAARPGEELVTLDGEKRKLDPPMLTIADSNDATGLAGVMGGAVSEMRDDTSAVLLESANFDPVNTRRTAAALRLGTEASHRFERGIRAELAARALRRATQLIVEVAGGTAAKGIIDLHPGRADPPVVKITTIRTRQVLGMEVSTSRIEEILTSLGFRRAKGPEALLDLAEAIEAGPVPERDTDLWMEVPYWRSDIEIEDDIVEEIARIIGYDALPTTMLSSPLPHSRPNPERPFREAVRDSLTAAGMQEVVSYSLTSLESLRGLETIEPAGEPLRVANPLSAAQSHLRTSLRGSALETLAANMRTSQGAGFRLFEVSAVYLPREEARERDLPNEKHVLIGVVSGPRFGPSWLTPQPDMDFYDAKGALEALFRGVGATVSYEPSTDANLLPGRTARITCRGKPVGVVGEVDPVLLARFDIEETAVAMFEVDVDALLQASPEALGRYRPASRFPESDRDFALVVDAEVSSDAILSIIGRHRLVASATPFDVYSGDEIPAGKKSLAYRVVFQSETSTLTAEQVNRAQRGILTQLQREVGAELRA